jgi:hypothetical protein
MTEAARVWFILQYFGLPATVLNGGRAALSDIPPQLPPSSASRRRRDSRYSASRVTPSSPATSCQRPFSGRRFPRQPRCLALDTCRWFSRCADADRGGIPEGIHRRLPVARQPPRRVVAEDRMRCRVRDRRSPPLPLGRPHRRRNRGRPCPSCRWPRPRGASTPLLCTLLFSARERDGGTLTQNPKHQTSN